MLSSVKQYRNNNVLTLNMAALSALSLALCTVCLANPSANQRLVKDLFESDHYDKRVRPVKKGGGPINVTFRLDLYQILEVNEPKQSITLNAWIEEMWHDDAIVWDPAEYDGIEELTVPHDVTWLPDTVLYNNLEMDDEKTRRLLNVQLKTLGDTVQVKILYPTIYTFSCNLDILNFPFDVQRCDMVFGSWTASQKDIDYYPKNESAGLSSYIKNEGWELVDFVGITTLLSMSILLLMVSDSMPTTSNYVPLIGRFYLAMIALISIGTVVSSLIIEVQKQGMYGEPIGRCKRRIFYCLSKLTGTKVPSHVRHGLCAKKSKANRRPSMEMPRFNHDSHHHTATNTLPTLAPLVSPESDLLTTERTDRFNVGKTGDYPAGLRSNNSTPNGCLAGCDHTMHDIGSAAHRAKHPAHYQEVMQEYEWAAIVLERLALVTFLCLLGVCSIGILVYGAVATHRVSFGNWFESFRSPDA